MTTSDDAPPELDADDDSTTIERAGADGPRAEAPPETARASEPSAAPGATGGGGGGDRAPLFSYRLAVAAAVGSGLLYWIAFAGIDIWPLAFVAFVPLVLALRGRTPKQGAWLGLLCGLTMNLGGFYWLLEMLRVFSGFPTAICLVFVVIICAYQGGRLALMGWLQARAASRGHHELLAFAVAFAASELLYPLLFPWYFAATVHQVPALIQIADLGGPILVGLVLVGVNLALAELLLARVERRRVRRLELAVGLGSLAATLVYGAARVAAVDARVAKAPEARVGLIQGNMGLLQKRQNPNEGLQRHMRLTEQLHARDPLDFVVWSESSVTFAVPEELAISGHYMRTRFAARLGVPAIFGAVLTRRDPDPRRGTRFFNTALATDAKGEVTSRYDKHFLLMFGEYLPFGDAFPVLYSWSPHSGKFSPGTTLDPLLVEAKGARHRVATLICYEDILPGFANDAVVHGNPELLVNITNDAWFGDTAEPWQHLALAKFRAVEHRRFLVRTTNSGVSAVVDPVGRTVLHTGTFVEDAQAATIRWLDGTTVFEVAGQKPWVVASIGAFAMAFRRRRARASAPPARAPS